MMGLDGGVDKVLQSDLFIAKEKRKLSREDIKLGHEQGRARLGLAKIYGEINNAG